MNAFQITLFYIVLVGIAVFNHEFLSIQYSSSAWGLGLFSAFVVVPSLLPESFQKVSLVILALAVPTAFLLH